MEAGSDANDTVLRPPRTERQSRSWQVFGRRVPRSEIVFVSQMLLLYVVVGVSLFNLTGGNGADNSWVAVLGGCLGYVLPNSYVKPLAH